MDGYNHSVKKFTLDDRMDDDLILQEKLVQFRGVVRRGQKGLKPPFKY